MVKYNMTIDGRPYKAYFYDHFEAADFLDANDRDGAEVIVHGTTEVDSVYEILSDRDIGDTDYLAEIACVFLFGPKSPVFRKFTKSIELVELLQYLGYLKPGHCRP